jgi:hypothetical protein
MPLLSITRCVGSLMFPSRSEVLANASNPKTFNDGHDLCQIPALVPYVNSLAIGPILVLDSDRGGAANQDSDIGDRDTSLVNENEVCGPGIKWLEDYRPVAVRMNIDDIRIADQDGLEGSLKREGRPGTEPQGDRLIRGPCWGNRDQQVGQRNGE